MLVLLRVVTEDKSQMLIDNMDEWSVIIFAAVFGITPGFVTRLGLVVVTLLYPALISIRSLETPMASIRWLKYWVVYTISHMVFLLIDTLMGWMPGYYHIQLFYYTWVLFPYFSGRDRIFDRLSSLINDRARPASARLRDSVSPRFFGAREEKNASLSSATAIPPEASVVGSPTKKRIGGRQRRSSGGEGEIGAAVGYGSRNSPFKEGSSSVVSNPNGKKDD